MVPELMRPSVLLRALITGKSANTKIEFLRFLPVGAVTTFIDFGLLILLTEVFHMYYLLSAAIGFVAGQIWSYVMCVNWVFAKFKHTDHISGFTYFFILSTIGLGITEFFLWFFTEQVQVHYIASKVIASAVSFFSLFLVRKRMLFT